MVVIMCFYIDDILIVGSDDKMIKSTKNMLNSRFGMKDIKLSDMILEIKITRMSNSLILNQSHYVDKILEKFNKDDSGIASVGSLRVVLEGVNSKLKDF